MCAARFPFWKAKYSYLKIKVHASSPICRKLHQAPFNLAVWMPHWSREKGVSQIHCMLVQLQLPLNSRDKHLFHLEPF